MNNIILIGFMGSGKTSIGQELSDRKYYRFLDTDSLIEQSQNRKISEIFSINGEEAFREMETCCLLDLLKDISNESHIISVGGGLPLRKVNRDLLKQLGYIIYLRAKSKTLYERLKDDVTRPLLQGECPEKRIEHLLDERDSIYEAVADAVIDVDNKKIEEIIMEIIKIMECERME